MEDNQLKRIGAKVIKLMQTRHPVPYNWNDLRTDFNCDDFECNQLATFLYQKKYVEKAGSAALARLTERGQKFRSRLLEDLPAEYPKNQQRSPLKNITTSTILKSCWEIISKNALISTIVGTIIATIILRACHVI